LLIATPSETLELQPASWVTSRLWENGHEYKSAAKNTRPILKKVAISFDSGPAAKNAEWHQVHSPAGHLPAGALFWVR